MKTNNNLEVNDTEVLTKCTKSLERYEARINMHKFMKRGSQFNVKDLNTNMKLDFDANDNLHLEQGFVIPSLSFQHTSSLKEIKVRFDDILALKEEIKKGKTTYLINSYVAENVADCDMNYVEQDVVISVKKEKNFLIITAQYGEIGEKFNTNTIQDSETFVVEYSKFKLFTKVIENCIIAEAKIQNCISDNLFKLPIEMKRMIDKMSSSYSDKVSYYIKRAADLFKKSSSYSRRSFGSNTQALINFVVNRNETSLSVIDKYIAFISEDLHFMPESFYINFEQFKEAANTIQSGKKAVIHAPNNIITHLEEVKKMIKIVVYVYPKSEKLQYTDKKHEYTLHIDKNMFMSIHETLNK